MGNPPGYPQLDQKKDRGDGQEYLQLDYAVLPALFQLTGALEELLPGGVFPAFEQILPVPNQPELCFGLPECDGDGVQQPAPTVVSPDEY